MEDFVVVPDGKVYMVVGWVGKKNPCEILKIFRTKEGAQAYQIKLENEDSGYDSITIRSYKLR
jgi:hypothetical protein